MRSLLLMLPLLAPACRGLEGLGAGAGPRPGSLTLFLRAEGPAGTEAELDLSAIEAGTAQGERRVLASGPGLTLRSRDLREAERAILTAPLPGGEYVALMFRVAGGTLRDASGTRPIADGPVEAVAAAEFSVPPGEGTTLFLAWNPAASPAAAFSLVVAAPAVIPQVRSALLYISREKTGTIAVWNRRERSFAGDLQVGPGVRGIALAPTRDRLFVAGFRSGTVTLLDLTQNRVLDTLRLRFRSEPADVLVTPDGRRLYVAESGTDTVGIFDAQTLVSLGDVTGLKGSVKLEADPRRQRVLSVNSLANAVTLIDDFSLRPEATLPADPFPVGVAIDRSSRRIFVACRDSSRLVVYDAASLEPLPPVEVGPGATAVVADPTGESLYVARAVPPSIAVVSPSVGAVTRTIRLRGAPRNLVADPDGRWLYASCRDPDGISVVDRISSREHAFIPLPGGPFDLTLAE